MTSSNPTLDNITLFQKRLRYFRWAVPISFALIATLYQLFVAQWVENLFGISTHFVVEILFFATAGPLSAYWVIQKIELWHKEKEEAETIARRSERRLASIVSASADGIISVDPNGLIESWNRGAEMIFGFSNEEMHNQHFQVLFGEGEPASVEYKWLSENIKTKGWIRGHETNAVGRNNNSIAVELTGAHLVNETGDFRGISFILREITGRKRREEEIRKLNETLNYQVKERTQELADKVIELNMANIELKKLDQTRSEFISLVSHQIRAPLTNMQGAVERMQTECGHINSVCSRMHPILEQQILRLNQLVKDVLNVSQIEAGEISVTLEPLSIFPVIRQVADQFKTRSTNRLIEIIDKPGMPLVLADRARVIEIIANLIDNADKYSEQDQKISVEVRANETEVVISVLDYGQGILPNALELIFDKFYRSDNSDSQTVYGYGLGLYVCRLLVEAQGGRIWAENRPDKGSIISFMLPFWRDMTK